jgi:hypothetical protein
MKIYETRNNLINELDKDLIICEIGVFKGDYSKIIYNTLKPQELHLIDLFDGQHPSGDKDGKNIVWANLNEEYNKLKSWSNENKNILLHKGKSYEILEEFENDYFDIIYIDGDNSYEGVKKDFDLYSTILSENGVIIIHDTDTSYEETLIVSEDAKKDHYRFDGPSKLVQELQKNESWNLINLHNFRILVDKPSSSGITIINRKK